jgi:long-chain acyl-CoA synthetase
MEATATTATTTGSRTIADLIPRAVAAHPDRIAVRFKRGGAWHDVSYSELAQAVQEIGLGLIDVGIEPGERVCILANTRPEWSYADMGATSAGAVVVPIYQTNSPEECLWVISDSDACAVICEDAEQLSKIAAIKDQVPNLRTVIVIDPPAADAGGNGGAPETEALDAIPLEQVRARGRTRSAEELEARRAAVRPEDAFTFIYTSGTTGPPKGCVLSHGNYRAIVDMVSDVGEIQGDEVTYLYLPLAHSFALLIQLAAFDLGSTLAYFGGDTKQIVSELLEVKPTYLPSVPRVFEKIYTLAHGAIEAQPPEEQQRAQAAIEVGVKVRDMMARGEDVPAELQKQFDEADRARDPRVLLRVRDPRVRGLRHDRDGHRSHHLHARAPPLRHGRAGATRSGAEDRRRRRDPDQRPEHLPGLPQARRSELRRGRGRLAAHR